MGVEGACIGKGGNVDAGDSSLSIAAPEGLPGPEAGSAIGGGR